MSGTAVGAWYRAIDTAVVDAYFAARLLDPAGAGSENQRCLRTDNRVSRRPSILVNPPLSEAAIAQRRSLVEALVAYEVAIVSRTTGEPQVDVAIAMSDAQKAAWALRVGARQHAAGDLFIEDLAAAFVTGVDRVAATHTTADLRQPVLETEPVVAKLMTILNSDVVQRRAQALNAARLDYDAWLEVYDARRTRKEVVSRSPVASIPRCFEPVLIANEAPLVSRDVAHDGLNFPGRQTIVMRLQTARARYDALKNANPEPLLGSLALLDAAAVGATEAPTSAASSTGSQALARFREAAQLLCKAAQPLK